MRRRRTVLVAVAALAATAVGTFGVSAPAAARTGATPAKTPTALGRGGAIATVDLDASRVGLSVLRSGGNAVDAAVAAAATLGVTEPFSAGIGGGGFFLVYDAATGKVTTINGRETAPARFRRDSFIDPRTGAAIPFYDAVSSGLSVGVPGTLATWTQALDRFGSRPLGQLLEPAAVLAEHGFLVDQTFHNQTAQNKHRFNDFTSTHQLYFPHGYAPPVGSLFRNPDLARTYREIAARGADWFYRGELAREIARTAQHPPLAPSSTRRLFPGLMTTADLAAYTAPYQAPTSSDYRGLRVYGMAPPSSGGTTVGEALNILGWFDLLHSSRLEALHHYLEASRLAFADRGRYVGDPAYVDVPVRQLLSDAFAHERACLIDPRHALTSPVPPGSPDGSYGTCHPGSGRVATDTEGPNTTHVTVADRWGNVVSYTLTIEQTGGSGIVVPGRGFLLNNELTDFSFGPPVPGVVDPNLPAPGKRPRSSMSPTIILSNGKPYLALGSPGGSTIITTVLQILVDEIDLGMSLPQAIAAPRISQRNADPAQAEPAFLALPVTGRLEALGQQIGPVARPAIVAPQYFSPEIGAATGIRFFDSGVLQAAAEPTRRGGGSALVVSPAG